MGRLGQKTGRGFYHYADGARTGARDPEVEALIERLAAENGSFAAMKAPARAA